MDATMHALIDEAVQHSTIRVGVDTLTRSAKDSGSERALSDVFAIDATRYGVVLGHFAGDEAEANQVLLVVRTALGDASASYDDVLERAACAVSQARVALPTILVGILDCTSGTLSYASLGQIVLALCYTDGVGALLPISESLFGPSPASPMACVAVDLRGVVRLALVAGGGPPLQTGVALRTALGSDLIARAARPTLYLADVLLADHDCDASAIVVLSFAGLLPTQTHVHGSLQPRWTARWALDTRDIGGAPIRHAFMDHLATKTASLPIDLAAAELIFGEMFSNVVRHAPGPVEIVLDWTERLPVLHMLDNGPGFVFGRAPEPFSVDEWSESGRGLFIVKACAHALSIHTRPGRGTHASATLRTL